MTWWRGEGAPPKALQDHAAARQALLQELGAVEAVLLTVACGLSAEVPGAAGEVLGWGWRQERWGLWCRVDGDGWDEVSRASVDVLRGLVALLPRLAQDLEAAAVQDDGREPEDDQLPFDPYREDFS